MADSHVQATQLTSVALPISLHREIRLVTKNQGVSMKFFIAQACRDKIAVMKAAAS
jgi:hypothetical protein